MTKNKEHMIIEFRDCLGINRTEGLILIELEKATRDRYKLLVTDIVETLGRDRTTVQKILIKMQNRKFVTRFQQNMHRGFLFKYQIKEGVNFKEEIKKTLKDRLKQLEEY